MTSAQLADYLEAHNLNVKKFAPLVFTRERTVYRWLEGKSIPAYVDGVLELRQALCSRTQTEQALLDSPNPLSMDLPPAGEPQ